jgi:predicted deacylase
MRIETIQLPLSMPGTHHSLTVLRYGNPGARPKIYLQASLHADEVPGMLVLHHLRALLQPLEDAGKIKGEIVVVPSANPLGLAQHVHGTHMGRFHLVDGLNFNRGFPYLTPGVANRVEGRLTADAAHNVATIRAAALEELAVSRSHNEHQQLKRALLRLALDADVVLDLHCDSEAAVHVYCGTPLVQSCAPLARLLGARALLYAEESGDEPFDEACGRHWWELAAQFRHYPIAPACMAVTVELRGEADVNHATARHDAQALLAFLIHQQAIDAPMPVLPEPLYTAAPLVGSEPLVAPISGIVVFHRAPGDDVSTGDLVAEVIDPISGETAKVCAGTTGVLYARISTRFAFAGKRLAKISGKQPIRSGKLLSP